MSKTGKPDNAHEDEGSAKVWKLVLALLYVFVLWAGFGIVLNQWEPTERGTFGDMFGAVNALFSGMAFAVLIYTVYVQRDELALQRKELACTREELRRTAQAQELSEVALRAQADAASQSARLAAVDALLAHYRSELLNLTSGINFPNNNDPRALQLRQKVQNLTEILDATYYELEQHHDGVKPPSPPTQDTKRPPQHQSQGRE